MLKEAVLIRIKVKSKLTASPQMTAAVLELQKPVVSSLVGAVEYFDVNQWLMLKVSLALKKN